MPESQGSVLPIYFVADESGSMAGSVHELNKGLVSVLDAMATETMAAAKVRMCVVGFSDSAICHLPMADLRKVDRMPTLSVRGSTSYAAAFDFLRQALPRDIAALKADGYAVHRPAVFFLTDGQPNDGEDWIASLTALTSPGFREHPNIVSFGIGDADPRIIVKVATKEEFAFQAAEGADTGRAIANFSTAFTHSIVTSGQSLASGKAELQGERPDGFVMAVDLI